MNAQHQAILAFIQPDETALSLIQRLKYENVTTGLRFLDQQGLRFKPGTTFEIAGPPGSGKTLLLLQIAAHCLSQGLDGLLSPPTGQHQDAAAMDRPPRRSVLLVDMDSKIQPQRVAEVIEQELARAYPAAHAQRTAAIPLLSDHRHAPPVPQPPGAAPPPDLARASRCVQCWEDACRDCLSRLTLVTPQSSLETLASLLAANQLMNQQKAQGIPYSMVLIDNVGAFSYADKAHRAHPYNPTSTTPAQPPPPQEPSPGTDGDPASPLALTPALAGLRGPPIAGAARAPPPLPPLNAGRVQAALSAALEGLSRRHRLCVVATKLAPVSFQEADEHGPSRLSAKEYMTAAWSQTVTHRLLLAQLALIPGHIQGQPPISRVPTQLHKAVQGGNPTTQDRAPVHYVSLTDQGADRQS